MSYITLEVSLPDGDITYIIDEDSGEGLQFIGDDYEPIF
jgi:hypothetical protein